MKIKVCSIKQTFYDMFDDNIELEKNEKRPCLIIVKLKYRGIKCDFAIPFRSNIKHEHFYKTTTDKTNSGIDFSKSVIITDEKYISPSKAKLRDE